MLRRVSLMTSRANELANPIGQYGEPEPPQQPELRELLLRAADPQNPHAGKIPEIQSEYFIFLQNSVRIFFIAVAGIYSVAREPALTPRHEPDSPGRFSVRRLLATGGGEGVANNLPCV
jgi:hypothetical protein